MAAPTPSTRVTPHGFKMDDGYQAFIVFSNDTSVQLWEKTVKPVGVDGEDGIVTTTMHNIAWRTKDAKHLKTLTNSEAKCAYDPDVYVYLINEVNVPQVITYHSPSNDSICFYGYLGKFEPDALEEGKQPEATVMIIPTNWDYINFVEAAPVYTPAPGT